MNILRLTRTGKEADNASVRFAPSKKVKVGAGGRRNPAISGGEGANVKKFVGGQRLDL